MTRADGLGCWIVLLSATVIVFAGTCHWVAVPAFALALILALAYRRADKEETGC